LTNISERYRHRAVSRFATGLRNHVSAVLTAENQYFIMNIVQIIQKIEWSNVIDNKTLQSADGWQLSYSVELHYSNPFSPSAQLVFKVSKNGAYVLTWGCTNEDQQEAVDAFLEAKSKVYEAQAAAENHVRAEAKALLASLF